MKTGLRYLLILTVSVTIIGGVGGLVVGKTFIGGAYRLSLIIAVVLMLVGSYYMIGTPKRRYDFYFNSKMAEKETESKFYENFIPAVLAVWMLLWGFFLESLMH